MTLITSGLEIFLFPCPTTVFGSRRDRVRHVDRRKRELEDKEPLPLPFFQTGSVTEDKLVLHPSVTRVSPEVVVLYTKPPESSGPDPSESPPWVPEIPDVHSGEVGPV